MPSYQRGGPPMVADASASVIPGRIAAQLSAVTETTGDDSRCGSSASAASAAMVKKPATRETQRQRRRFNVLPQNVGAAVAELLASPATSVLPVGIVPPDQSNFKSAECRFISPRTGNFQRK